MINDSIFEYVKMQKLNGISDGDIRKELLNNNWDLADINEVLGKVNRIKSDTPFEINEKDRETVFVVDKEEINPSLVISGQVKVPIGDKPKIVPNIASILFLIITFLFIYKAGYMIAIMSIVNYYSHTTGAIYYFLNEFPLYGLVIMAFSVSACVFLYNSVKVSSGTRFSLWFGILSLIVIPVSLSYINFKLMYSVSEYFTSEAIVLKQNAPDIPEGTSTIVVGVLGEPAFFVSFGTLLFLLITHKKFNFPRIRLSSRSVKILTIFILLFILPTALIVNAGYRKAKKDDFEYSFVSSRVNFHVYRPDPVPLGLVYATNFVSGKDFGGRNDAIHVTYDFALDRVPDSVSSRLVVLKQVEVPKNFSIGNYLMSESGTYSTQKQLSLDISNDKNAYLIENKIPNGDISKNLIFLTPDNVLISISTVKSSEYDLLDIARSLK